MPNVANENTINQETGKRKRNKPEDFKRVCAPRVDRALKAIEVIGHCANRSNYEYTPEQVDAIREVLQSALNDTLSKFVPATKEAREKFTF